MVASSPLLRLRGLAGRRPDSTVMVFPRCRDVHTLTMRHPLDVAFLDRRGRVVAVHRLVLPGGAPALRSSLGGSGALCPAGAWFVEAMCVCSPMLRDAESRGRPLSQELRALRKRRAAGERLRTKPREGDIDENLPSLREHPVR